MKEFVVIDHVPFKTHVFVFSDSPPAPHDLILKLMIQTTDLKFLEKYTLNILSMLPICHTHVKTEGGF